MTDGVPRHGEKMDDGKTEYCGFCDAFLPIGHTSICIGVDPDLIEDDDQMYAAVDSYPERLKELRQREGSYLGEFIITSEMERRIAEDR